MLKRPWQQLRSPRADDEYVAMVTYFLLKSFRGMPRFNLYTKRVRRQLAESAGLLGYTLGAKPWRKQFWTLSVWEDEKALRYWEVILIHRECPSRGSWKRRHEGSC